ERASEHPIGAAIVQGAASRGIELGQLDAFNSLPGKGVVGRVDGREVQIGNSKVLGNLRIQAGGGSDEVVPVDTRVQTQSAPDSAKRPEPGDQEALDRAETLREDGMTVMFVVIDGNIAGLLGVSDPVKETAAEAIRMLHQDGLRIVMLTGDHKTAAEAVARRLGIDEVVADLLPEQKQDVINRLQQERKRVAMAGDGVNDAPALARADVGIAMGTGTDVAIETAGITLIKGDLSGILRARKLSRATMRNIRQNLFFAFVYNSIGVPIAAGVLYPFFGLLLSPILASAAMSFSSVSVVTNALRLGRAKL